MGYEVEMTDSNARLPVQHYQRAYGVLLADQTLDPELFRDGWLERVKEYSSVTQLLTDMGFTRVEPGPPPHPDPCTGDQYSYTFGCFFSKWRDDVPQVLLRLGPFLEPTDDSSCAYMEFVGEDHDRWRYEFDGTSYKHLRPMATQWVETPWQ